MTRWEDSCPSNIVAIFLVTGICLINGSFLTSRIVFTRWRKTTFCRSSEPWRAFTVLLHRCSIRYRAMVELCTKSHTLHTDMTPFVEEPTWKTSTTVAHIQHWVTWRTEFGKSFSCVYTFSLIFSRLVANQFCSHALLIGITSLSDNSRPQTHICVVVYIIWVCEGIRTVAWVVKVVRVWFAVSPNRFFFNTSKAIAEEHFCLITSGWCAVFVQVSLFCFHTCFDAWWTCDTWKSGTRMPRRKLTWLTKCAPWMTPGRTIISSQRDRAEQRWLTFVIYFWIAFMISLEAGDASKWGVRECIRLTKMRRGAFRLW